MALKIRNLFSKASSLTSEAITTVGKVGRAMGAHPHINHVDINEAKHAAEAAMGATKRFGHYFEKEAEFTGNVFLKDKPQSLLGSINNLINPLTWRGPKIERLEHGVENGRTFVTDYARHRDGSIFSTTKSGLLVNGKLTDETIHRVGAVRRGGDFATHQHNYAQTYGENYHGAPVAQGPGLFKRLENKIRGNETITIERNAALTKDVTGKIISDTATGVKVTRMDHAGTTVTKSYKLPEAGKAELVGVNVLEEGYNFERPGLIRQLGKGAYENLAQKPINALSTKITGKNIMPTFHSDANHANLVSKYRDKLTQSVENMESVPHDFVHRLNNGKVRDYENLGIVGKLAKNTYSLTEKTVNAVAGRTLKGKGGKILPSAETVHTAIKNKAASKSLGLKSEHSFKNVIPEIVPHSGNSNIINDFEPIAHNSFVNNPKIQAAHQAKINQASTAAHSTEHSVANLEQRLADTKQALETARGNQKTAKRVLEQTTQGIDGVFGEQTRKVLEARTPKLSSITPPQVNDTGNGHDRLDGTRVANRLGWLNGSNKAQRDNWVQRNEERLALNGAIDHDLL